MLAKQRMRWGIGWLVLLACWGVGGAAWAQGYEDVLHGADGTVLRGEIVGDKKVCQNRQPQARCLVRIQGGSILSIPADQVTKITRERRYRTDTGHGGQLGIYASGGILAGFGYQDKFAFLVQAPLMASLTYGITDALEINLGYTGTLGGAAIDPAAAAGTPLQLASHYGTIGLRYFIVPNDAIKLYNGGQILLGTGIGLRTYTGYQLDIGRHFGLFIESGFLFRVEFSGAFSVSWNGQLGLHVRF